MFGQRLFGRPGPARRHETGGQGGACGSERGAVIASGLIRGTQIATAMGWRPVEAVIEGDLVLTFDRGLQPVREITWGLQWSGAAPLPRRHWPLHVPAGALGNDRPMRLLPEQTVLVESDTAEALFGDPFTLIVAADLDGFRGIERVAPAEAEVVLHLHFDHDEVVIANAGALLYAPSVRSGQVAGLLDAVQAPGYVALPSDEAQMLVDCLIDEDAQAAGAALHASAEAHARAAAHA